MPPEEPWCILRRLFTEVSSTTSLTIGEPAEKSFFECFLEDKSGLWAPILSLLVLIRDSRAEFRTQALLCCTDLAIDPERIISWFVRRWKTETTFQEVRQRLGFETQRH
jgi:hypothetical protein